MHLRTELLITQERQKAGNSAAGSLLRDVSFYGQVGGQNHMRNSERKHFDLDFEPVTVPSNSSCLPQTPRIPLTTEGPRKKKKKGRVGFHSYKELIFLLLYALQLKFMDLIYISLCFQNKGPKQAALGMCILYALANSPTFH